MDTAHEFTRRLTELLREERGALAEFIVALAEFDRRKLWLELGHASLFAFLHRELALSKGAAYYRMTAARLVQAYPEVVDPLRDGRLCFTSVVELSKAITPENRHDVLPRYFHVSKLEARAVTAALRPAEIVPTRTVVTAARPEAAAVPPMLALPAPGPPQPTRDEPVGTQAVHPDEPPRVARPEPVRLLAPVPAASNARTAVEPLAKEAVRLHLTAPPRLLAKLAAARDALSHAKPGATDAEVIEAALDALLAGAAKRKALVDRPRKSPPATEGDGIPAHVKRAVWLRDGGCCQWKSPTGETCGSTYQPEFDHRLARALGGQATVDNIRVLCRVHNQLAARQTFGDDWMSRFGRKAGLSPGEAPRTSRPDSRPENTVLME